jgi:hypothetical protein
LEGMTRLAADSPLARSLERGRERLNARVAWARRQGRSFDSAVFSEHLCAGLGPIISAVASVAPDRVDAVTEALFGLSIDLVARDVVGPMSRQPVAEKAWVELLPLLSRHLAAEPLRVAASITNAAFHIGNEATARSAEWLSAMAALAPACENPDLLLGCGKVLAWRAGMAHFRESAIANWEGLPDSLAALCLGVDRSSPREQLRATLAERWTPPGSPPRPAALEIVASVGGFRGFGGPFVTPPGVIAGRSQVFATDAGGCFAVFADCFGQTLKRVADQRPEPEVSPVANVEDDGTVTFGGLTARLPRAAGASDFAACEGYLALTFARSHRIVLVAKTGASA